jgi:hypothetical protein
MAIWRRKLTIPVSLKHTHGEAIRKCKEEIAKRRTFIVVDESVLHDSFCFVNSLLRLMLSSFKPPPPQKKNPERLEKKAPEKKAPEKDQPPPKKKWFRWAA